MKIAIVSNCQGEGLAKCLREMNGSLEPHFFIVTSLWDGTANLADILRDYDLVLAQKFIEQHIGEEHKHKVHYFPSFAFAAFHPDITYTRGKRIGGEMETVYSPMAHYSSALVLHGYSRGLSVDEIVASFNVDTFSRLGYLNVWEKAKEDFLNECRDVGLPGESLFESWERQGCFMHSFNHPTIRVISDVAAELLKKLGIDIYNVNPARYLIDDLRAMPIWPIYPDIASALGIEGDYVFKQHDPHGFLNLRQFVEASVEGYRAFERESLEPLNISLLDMDRALGRIAGAETTAANPPAGHAHSANPYRGLAPFHFWKNSVAQPAMADVDPVSPVRFAITREDKVATAGSCFAQHIAKTLTANGFNYFVPEIAPAGLDDQTAFDHNYGVFSARYGNVYTVRQLVQMVKRVSGSFCPVDQHWTRKDGRFVDPFRPQIEPNGFADLESLENARRDHFAAVARMLREMNVFIFTLGLTEGWRSKIDGAVFPLAPGVAGGAMEPDRYEFVNFTVSEVIADVEEFIALLQEVNPACKVILTVSPVPLIATYEDRHVLSATVYSKSVLRVAADEIRAKYPNVEYFPSYEIITGSYTRGQYFEEDLRSVTTDGVAHVMRLFMSHYLGASESTPPSASPNAHQPSLLKNVAGIVCDEEAITNFALN